jgi:Leucine-rich repeat (LRR) protein
MAVKAAEEGEGALCQLLQQGAILQPLVQYLSDKELARLAQTCRPMKAALDQELVRRQEQKAFWLEGVLNAKYLNCSYQRENYANNEAFKDYVIKQIVDFNKENPGRWIKLNLGSNNLGNNPVFLQDLINTIADTVKSLNIDIAVLRLSYNQLTTLPENVFNGLSNLQQLGLDNNQLTSLPENAFNGLSNLRTLVLDFNTLMLIGNKTNQELGLGNDVIISFQ